MSKREKKNKVTSASDGLVKPAFIQESRSRGTMELGVPRMFKAMAGHRAGTGGLHCGIFPKIWLVKP